MGFENPLALTLLLLIPLLLFMRRQRTPVVRPVANLYLWRESAARDTNTVTRRIRRDWLLILQAAFLALVAFAMARPVISETADSVALVFDTSLSMGARQGSDTRLELAKARAATLVDQLPSSTRVIVLSGANDAASRPYRASDSAVLDAVRAVRPTDGASVVPQAVERARHSSPTPSRIYVLSDTDASMPSSRAGDLEWIRVGGAVENAAVTVLSARPSLDQAGRAQILVSVANYGATPMGAVLRLDRDGVELERRTINVAARENSSYTFDVANVGGILAARLDHPDALAADNIRWLSSPAAAIRVFSSQPSFFIEKALAAGPEFVAVSSADDADVVVCDRCATVPPGRAGVLRTAPPSAGDVVATLTGGDEDHPIADGLSIDGLTAIVRGPIVPPAGSTVLARGNGGPLLLARQTDSRRVVDAHLDFGGGPFPLNSAFPVLVANAVRWLAARDLNPTTVAAGEPMRWRVGDQRAAAVIGPDGQALPATTNNGIVSTTATAASGVYQVQIGSDKRPVVVNPVVEGESNLEPAAAPAIAEAAAIATSAPRYRNLAVALIAGALLLLAFEWRHQLRSARGAAAARRRTLVRCAVAALLLVALTGVEIASGKTPITVMFLVDASHSMTVATTEMHRRLSDLAARLGREDRAGVIVFGSNPVVERAVGAPENAGGQISATVAGADTDIEAALRLARVTMADAEARRIVLLSDGHETRGDAAQEASRAAADGIRIDSVVPPVTQTPRLLVSRLSAPLRAAIDEPFTLTAVVEGPPGQRGELVVRSDDGTSIRREVRFGTDGSATETVTAREREPGLRVYQAGVRGLDGDFDEAVADPTAGTLVSISGRPRVLIVAAAPTQLGAVLGSSFGTRQVSPQTFPRSAAALRSFDAVLLDDIAGDALDDSQLSALTEHVEGRGAGLFVLGSARSLDASIVPDTGLGRLLPVDVRPRSGVRSPELALVVVFDKSGSMEERVGGITKIDLARQSITRVLGAVPATDAVGVIAFDSKPAVVATIRAGHDPRAIAEQLRSLAPAGATAIAPAVDMAGQWLAAYPSTVRRHILLVSDGRSSSADSERLRTLAREGRFTLSVISLGADRDRQFLSSVAAAAGGRAYFPDDERELPTIAAREAARVAGGRVVEETFVPRTSAHPIVSGVDPRAMPSLSGYVVTAARRSTEVALSSHRDDPIVATWQFGVGRVAVYTAGLSTSWSTALRQSPVFASLMNQTVRWLAGRQPADLLYTRLQVEGDHVRVMLDAQMTDTAYASGLTSQATVKPPSGEPLTIALTERAPGRYEGTFPLSGTGEYILSLTGRSRDGRFDARMFRGFFWSADKEYRVSGVNRDLLSQVTKATGGMVLQDDTDPFSDRPSAHRNIDAWLLAAAFLIFLGELIGPGIVAIAGNVSRRSIRAERAAA